MSDSDRADYETMDALLTDAGDDGELPPRDETDGRGEGAGSWWEMQLLDACKRWGYQAARGPVVWGFESDVIAVHPDTLRRYLIQAKDWDDTDVTPTAVWRLISLSYATGCRPAIAITSSLSHRAHEICKMWRVTVITPGDVMDPDRDDFPDPERPLTNLDGYDFEERQNPNWESRLADSNAAELLTLNRPNYEQKQWSPRYR